MRRHASHIVSDGDTPADRVPPGRAVLSMPRALLLGPDPQERDDEGIEPVLAALRIARGWGRAPRVQISST
jgi:hypothetical protein